MRNERVPSHFSLVELLLPWFFFFLEVPGRQVFTSRLWLRNRHCFFHGGGFVYQAVSLILTQILFQLSGLCGFDAVVLLVLSCYRGGQNYHQNNSK